MATTKRQNMAKVVIYQSPDGGLTVRLCSACIDEFRARGVWPRDHKGREACQVSKGLTLSACGCSHCGVDGPLVNIW